MSIEAWQWAVKFAPPMPPQLLGALVGLAEHADSQGRDAYPSAKTLAAYACKSERSVMRDLPALEELGLIRRGDQSKVAHLPADKRPVVYDLALERTVPGGRAGDDEETRKAFAAMLASRERGRDTREAKKRAADSGMTPASPRGMTSTSDGGVTPASDGDMTSTSERPERHDVDVRSDMTSTSERHDVDVIQTVLEPYVEPSIELPAADKPRRTRKKASEAKPNKHAAADELAAAFWQHDKQHLTQTFIQIRGPIRTAVANGVAPRDEIARALHALALEGRPVSAGTLRIALTQLSNPQQRGGRPGAGGLTDDQWAAAAERARTRTLALAEQPHGETA